MWRQKQLTLCKILCNTWSFPPYILVPRNGLHKILHMQNCKCGCNKFYLARVVTMFFLPCVSSCAGILEQVEILFQIIPTQGQQSNFSFLKLPTVFQQIACFSLMFQSKDCMHNGSVFKAETVLECITNSRLFSLFHKRYVINSSVIIFRVFMQWVKGDEVTQ